MSVDFQPPLLATLTSFRRREISRPFNMLFDRSLVVHNHPSGDPTPSKADIAMTREIAEAAKALKIAVHDHLVIGRAGHASFKSLGLL